MRWRRLVYKAGFRPNPDSIFYSPTLDWERAADCDFCGRRNVLDGHGIGRLWICPTSDRDECLRRTPPKTLAYLLYAAYTAGYVAKDRVVSAIRREIKLWTWHR